MKWCHNIVLVLICLSVLCASRVAAAQQDTIPLNYGQKVPDFELTGVMNSSQKTLRFSELKGKLVIIDFFGTWCGGCVPYIPKLDSLQKVFDGRVQIIVLCHDQDNETVEKFIAKKWPGKKFQLPFVLSSSGNSITEKLFPHRMIPHKIWIGPDGTYLYSTDARAVNFANLQKALKGERLQVNIKKDQIQFDSNRPIFDRGNLWDLKPIISKTGFSHFIPGISSRSGRDIDSAEGTMRIYHIQQPLSELYAGAAGFKNIGRNRIVWKVKDKQRYFPSFNDQFEKNVYCMEVTLPLNATGEDWAHHFLYTLNANLKHKSRFDYVETTCYALVLKAGNDTTVIASKGGHRGMGRDEKNNDYIYSNMPINIVIASLNNDQEPILINETGVKGTIDIRHPFTGMGDIPKLSASLQQQGLDLIKVKRKLVHLIVEEAD